MNGQVKVQVLRDFISPVFGNVSAGPANQPTELTMDERTALKYEGIGLVKRISEEANDNPPVKPAASSSASQAGQVSQPQTAKPSGNGGKQPKQPKNRAR